MKSKMKRRFGIMMAAIVMLLASNLVVAQTSCSEALTGIDTYSVISSMYTGCGICLHRCKHSAIS